MVSHGDPSKYVHHVMDIESVGVVRATTGRGVTVIVGPADRGPAMEALGISSASEAKAYFYGGHAYEQAILALAQGVNQLYVIRVAGSGYAEAELDDFDSQSVPVKIGTWYAPSDGDWGNGVVRKIENGNLLATCKMTFNGSGVAQDKYYLPYDDLVENTTNRITVGGTSKTLVYTPEEMGANKVYCNKAEGYLQFYTGEDPATTTECVAYIKYHSRTITLTLGSSQREVYANIQNLTQLQAKTAYSALGRFVADTGMTHLPAVDSAGDSFAGGEDGAAITVDDWEAALVEAQSLPEGVYATTLAVTDYEVSTGQYDIPPLVAAYATTMADKMRPVQCFSPLNPVVTDQDGDIDLDMLTDLAAGYNNMWLTLGGNYYDKYGNCVVGAVAGKQAALQLSSDIAEANNAMDGFNSLLFQFNDSDREVLNNAGIDVLIKGEGITPYVGISTNSDENFKLLVDIATIADCIKTLDSVLTKFYHKRRTKSNLDRVKASMELYLYDYHKNGILDDYDFNVLPDPLDRNGGDVDMWIQPVGHILRWHTTLNVGYWSTELAE